MKRRRLFSYRRAVDAFAFVEIIALASAFAFYAHVEGLLTPASNLHGIFGLVAIALYAGLMGLIRRFETAQAIERPPSILATAANCLLACFAGATLCMVDHRVSPRFIDVVGFAAGLAPLAVALRCVGVLVLSRLVRRGMFDRRVVLYGGGAPAEAIVDGLLKPGPAHVEILGIFDDRSGVRRPPPISGVEHLGSAEDLIAFVRQTPVDMVIITLSISADVRILQLIDRLWILPVDIRLAMDRSELRFGRKFYSFVGGSALADLCDRPIAGVDGWLKAFIDRLIGSVCLLAALPGMLLIAIAIKATSRGPVLFRQKRYGFNNEVIEVFKFRSMYVETLDPKGDRTVVRDDPRVTPLGNILRKTSLDELPQLFNVVFKGNLSLVGPRPHVPSGKVGDVPYDAIVNHYFARHRVMPGMTGWAQIHGWRGSTMTPDHIERRVEFDLYYIEKWSIWLDLYILSMTPFAVIGGKSAY